MRAAGRRTRRSSPARRWSRGARCPACSRRSWPRRPSSPRGPPARTRGSSPRCAGAASRIRSACRSTRCRSAPTRTCRRAAGSCGRRRTCARSRPTTATRGRSRTSAPASTSPPARCSTCSTASRCRCRRSTATTQAASAAADLLKPLRHRPARRAELRARRPRAALAGLARCTSPCTRSTGLVLHDVALRRPLDPAPRRAAPRWSCPTATPTRASTGAATSTPASTASAGPPTPLTLGCDCLGEIRYLDAVMPDADGEPRTIAQRDLHPRGGRRDPLEALRHGHRDVGGPPRAPARGLQRRDARQLRLRLLLVAAPRRLDRARGALTGIVLTRGVRPGEPLRHATRLAPELAAPHHQHLFNVRLDMAVDGRRNRVYEVDMVASPRGPATVRRRDGAARDADRAREPGPRG